MPTGRPPLCSPDAIIEMGAVQPCDDIVIPVPVPPPVLMEWQIPRAAPLADSIATDVKVPADATPGPANGSGHSTLIRPGTVIGFQWSPQRSANFIEAVPLRSADLARNDLAVEFQDSKRASGNS